MIWGYPYFRTPPISLGTSFQVGKLLQRGPALSVWPGTNNAATSASIGRGTSQNWREWTQFGDHAVLTSAPAMSHICWGPLSFFKLHSGSQKTIDHKPRLHVWDTFQRHINPLFGGHLLSIFTLLCGSLRPTEGKHDPHIKFIWESSLAKWGCG